VLYLNGNPHPLLQSPKADISATAPTRSHAYTQAWVPACRSPRCLECSYAQRRGGRLLPRVQAEVMALAEQLPIAPNHTSAAAKVPSLPPAITNFHALILLFRLNIFVSEVSQLFPNYCLTGLSVIITFLFSMVSWGQHPSQKVQSVPLGRDFH